MFRSARSLSISSSSFSGCLSRCSARLRPPYSGLSPVSRKATSQGVRNGLVGSSGFGKSRAVLMIFWRSGRMVPFLNCTARYPLRPLLSVSLRMRWSSTSLSSSSWVMLRYWRTAAEVCRSPIMSMMVLGVYSCWSSSAYFDATEQSLKARLW